jgi:nicotinamidase-related amidase
MAIPSLLVPALLMLDLQQGILGRFQVDGYLGRVSKAINATREARMHIIHVRTAFRPGHPEISSRNPTSARVETTTMMVEGDATAGFVAQAAPLKNEIVVTKRRVSAFASTDLDAVLRALNVESLVIAGVATSGAVLSTVRQAADLDFNITVVKDLCFDPDEESHRVLVDKILPRQARVLSAENWIREMKK